MKITMLVAITGTRDGDEWPDVGGTLDVPDREAADLIAVGYAKEVDGATGSESDVDETETAEPDADPAEDSDTEPEPEPESVKKPAKKRSKKG